jgi:chemotaxis protein MotB
MAALTACGVPQPKYQAALAETGRAIRQAGEDRQRAEAAEKRSTELEARLAAAEQRNRDLTARLGEQERAAAWSAPAPSSSSPPVITADPVAPREGAPQPGPPRSEPQVRSVEYVALSASLEEELRAGRIQLLEVRGRLTARFTERLLFLTGSATVSSDGRRALRQLAEVLKTARGRQVRVESHTDSIPIRTEAFPSNWELSTARAAAVVKALQEQGLNPALLSGAGLADAQPIASNETSEGRARNRRLEVTVAPPIPLQPAVPAAPAAAERAPMVFPMPSSTGGEPPQR